MGNEMYSVEVDVFFAKVLSFAFVFSLILGVKFYIANRGKATGRREQEGQDACPKLYVLFENEIRFLAECFGNTLAAGMSASVKAKRDELALSGLPLTLGEVYGAQIFCTCSLVALAAVGMFLLSMSLFHIIIVLGLMALCGWILPRIQIQRTVQERQKALSKAIPFALDVVTSAMEGGAEFIAAFRHYVRVSKPNPLRSEFDIALKRMQNGKSRVEALKEMAEKIQLPEFRSIANAVAQGTEMGSSLCEILRVQASEIRRARMTEADKQAQKAPSLMLLPMLLFIFPSAFIIIITPILLKLDEAGLLGQFTGGR